MPHSRIPLLSAVTLFLLAGALHAQDATTEPWANISLRIGPTFAFMSGSFVEDGGNGATGVEVRLAASKRVFSVVDFMTGFGMIQKGGQGVAVTTTDTLLSYKFSYLQFPFVLRPRFRLGDSRWSIAPEAGVYVALGQGCKLKQAELYHFDTECSPTTAGGDIESLEIGVPIGVTALLEFVGGSRIEFEARTDIGLTNVLQGTDSVGQSVTNRVLILQIGLSYPL